MHEVGHRSDEDARTLTNDYCLATPFERLGRFAVRMVLERFPARPSSDGVDPVVFPFRRDLVHAHQKFTLWGGGQPSFEFSDIAPVGKHWILKAFEIAACEIIAGHAM